MSWLQSRHQYLTVFKHSINSRLEKIFVTYLEDIKHNFPSYNFWNTTGSLVSILSVGFVLGVKNISDFRIENSSCLFQLSEYCFSGTPLVFLFIAAIVIILVKKILNISRYHGPADVILSAHSPSTELDAKTGFLSTFSAFISASGGASVGQYGPLVHLGVRLVIF